MKPTYMALMAGVSLVLATSCRAGAETSPRQRILLDAGWRFHRGELPGDRLIPAGTPIVKWAWLADDNGPHDAARMAAPNVDTSAGGWKGTTTGEDVFHGREGYAWYRTTLPAFHGRDPVIHFERVDDNGTVYLNGKPVDSHIGWSEAFDVDLKAAWNARGPNRLAVLVQNTAGEGGITRPAQLQDGQAELRAAPINPRFNDKGWQVVHLPDDYIVRGTFSPTADAGHGSLPVETGWYRLGFDIPASDRGKSLWIDFDGVYRDSIVWLNGRLLGRHPSGYTSFRYDIAPFANYGGRNVLSVHVDPTKFEGWWYEGGGIYRHVWLNVANPIHVKPWGTYVATDVPRFDRLAALSSGFHRPGDEAVVLPRAELLNDGALAATASVRYRVFDDSGNMVKDWISGPRSILAHGETMVGAALSVKAPKLWSLETPHLYRLVTTVRQGSRVLDQTETAFGIRSIRYDKDRGFFLNGKHVEIQGTCNHQDFVGVGIGVSDQLEAWRVKKLKEMGANAWRMSHNPPTPGLLDACDRLGMLVMDENRHLGDSKANLDEVASLVERDRNHPSIIMWSMCNEQGEAGSKEGGVVFKAMKDTVLKYDRTRPISSAMNSGWFGDGFTYVEDLMGVNYNIEVYDRFHREHPNMPMYASETASTVTTRGEYADNPKTVAVSSYNMTDYSWSSVARRPFMAGSFVWTGFDYKGEPSPYGWPSVNSHFGIMDMCGFPKDNYFYYQAWWKSKPMVHLMPHWNWPDKEGQDIKVIAFSNAAKVELLVNGQSMGEKAMPRYGHLEWTVNYEPGSIRARAFDAGGKLVAIDTVATTGVPVAIRLTTDRRTLSNDSEDVAVVDAAIVDAEGRVVPTASNLVIFTISGVGEVAGVGNGNPGDHDPDHASRRHAFHGLCAAVIRGGPKAGRLRLTASAPGLKPASLELVVSSSQR